MGYPIQLKAAVIKKVLQGNKPRHEIAKELGVDRSTIGKWLKEHKQNRNINLKSKEKRPIPSSALCYHNNFIKYEEPLLQL